MRGKKKKGRIVKPGQETTDKVAEGLINKLNAAGLKIDPKLTQNELIMNPKWTQNQPKGSKKPDCYYGWTIHCVLFLIAMEGA